MAKGPNHSANLATDRTPAEELAPPESDSSSFAAVCPGTSFQDALQQAAEGNWLGTTQLVLWSCLVLPFYFVKSLSKVLANWSNSQVYNTCIQAIVSLFHRSNNLNSLYPYFLLCGSVSLPSVCDFGPSDLMSQFSLLPLYTYFLFQSCMSWFHCSGGFSGFLSRRYDLLCSLLHQFEFPFESIASPSHPKNRHRCWYHRHYTCNLPHYNAVTA